MLKKMGWSGAAGLGASEQGIQEPIRASDTRESQDMYKGIGLNVGPSDEFEAYRRNRGQMFMNRIVNKK